MTVFLGDFVESARPISASAPLAHVVELFQNDTAAEYFILVRDKRPAGLISRSRTFEFAVSVGDEKLSRLAIGDLVTARALILKAETSVRDFALKAGDQLEALIKRGCIIVEDKRFKGVLSPTRLQQALIASLAQASDETDIPTSVPSTKPKPDKPPLLGTLAHEIRTPLTAIMGLSDMLSSRLRDEHHKELAMTIVRSSQSLDRILTDTLDYASLEAGKLTLRSESADLPVLAEDLRRMWSAEAARRGLSFRVGFVPNGPDRIETDLGRVRQIANNLISNALKFTKEGEVSATLSTQTVGQALMLNIAVSDTGRGLSQAQRERFMDVFEKGPDPDGAKGWGLGLTISQALARALDGRLIHAENPGGGSIFTLSIPVAHPVASLQDAAHASAPRRGKFQLGDVLLVEDHEASAMIVINALEQAGWTVHHAGTLHAAESFAALTSFQAVLTDLHLPDGNSLAFIEGLRRRRGPNAQTPIIALTADISPARLQACLASGADRALKKPVAAPELVATVADVLISRASAPPAPVDLRGRLAS